MVQILILKISGSIIDDTSGANISSSTIAIISVVLIVVVILVMTISVTVFFIRRHRRKKSEGNINLLGLYSTIILESENHVSPGRI